MATVASRRNAVTKLLGAFSSKGAGTSVSPVDGSLATLASFQGGMRCMMTTGARVASVRTALKEGDIAGSLVFRHGKSQVSAPQASRQTMRTFASSGGGHGEEIVHEGLKLHATAGWHKTVGEALSGLMWFWVFYRLYHDYEGFLFGHVGHHEHMLHEEAGHDD